MSRTSDRANQEPTPLFTAYLFAMGLYAMYGWYAKTGLVGWLMDLQMRFFGSAEEGISVLGVASIALLPLWPIERLFPTLLRRPKGPAAADAPFPWMQVAAPMILGVAIGLGVFIRDLLRDHRRGGPIAVLSLEGPVDLGGSQGPVKLEGTLRRTYRIGIVETRGSDHEKTELYVPFTASAASPQDEVRVIVLPKFGNTAVEDLRTGRDVDVDRNGPAAAVIGGELSAGDVPTYVLSSLRERGLRIADPVYLLEEVNFRDPAAGVVSLLRRSFSLSIPLFGLLASVAIYASEKRRRRATF